MSDTIARKKGEGRLCSQDEIFIVTASAFEQSDERSYYGKMSVIGRT